MLNNPCQGLYHFIAHLSNVNLLLVQVVPKHLLVSVKSLLAECYSLDDQIVRPYYCQRFDIRRLPSLIQKIKQ